MLEYILADFPLLVKNILTGIVTIILGRYHQLTTNYITCGFRFFALGSPATPFEIV